MTPDKAIVTALEPIEGLPDKVFPVEALKNATAPFVFYLQKEDEVEEDLEGETELQAVTFELHCVAKSYAALVSLAGAVRLALRDMRGQSYGDLFIERVKVRQASPDLNEREVKLMRRMYVLQLYYQRRN